MILADELLPKGGELQEPILSLRILDAAKGWRGNTDISLLPLFNQV